MWVRLLWCATLLLELEPPQECPRTSCGNAGSGSAGSGRGLRFCLSNEFPHEETLWGAKMWRGRKRSGGCEYQYCSPLPTLSFHILPLKGPSHPFQDINPFLSPLGDNPSRSPSCMWKASRHHQTMIWNWDFRNPGISGTGEKKEVGVGEEVWPQEIRYAWYWKWKQTGREEKITLF